MSTPFTASPLSLSLSLCEHPIYRLPSLGRTLTLYYTISLSSYADNCAIDCNCHRFPNTHRLARLQQIPNFPWPKNRSRTQEEEWSYKCGLLEDYVRNHGGKFPVEKYSMQDSDGEEINLGMWCVFVLFLRMPLYILSPFFVHLYITCTRHACSTCHTRNTNFSRDTACVDGFGFHSNIC